MHSTMDKVLIVGAGLAGCEAAYKLAQAGVDVLLFECKTYLPSEAHKLKTYAELVCSNSLKSMKEASAHGILKYEMQDLGSIILDVAQKTKVPSGDALSVDRHKFSEMITELILDHPKIQVFDEEVINPLLKMEEMGCRYGVVATGPLTSKNLDQWIIGEISSEENHYFYDAIAPVVDADSLDYTKLYFKDRYKEIQEKHEEIGYLNAPMSKLEYESFIEALICADKVPPREFENYKYFEGCLPIDLMAQRGKETARFSCMKPVGLEDRNNDRPYAVVQLRKENLLGSAYNLVGFQTRLTYSEQKRVFRMIPGMEKASFFHYGSIHRNSFIGANKSLNWNFSSQIHSKLFFAGQITGVEGYTESASTGLYVAHEILNEMKGINFRKWPVETAIGALVNYVMTSSKSSPSSINFGLMPPIKLDKLQRKDKKKSIIKKEIGFRRARDKYKEFMELL